MQREPPEQAGGQDLQEGEERRKWRFRNGEQPGGLREHADGAAESLGDGRRPVGEPGSPLRR